MLFADPLKPEHGLPRDTIISSGTGEFFQHFEDECFFLADGVPGTELADVASRLAIENALWAYKLVRQRQSYWLNRDLFVRRIFRSTNIALWQKHREDGYAAGLYASLLVCMFRGNNYWIGSTGSLASYLFRDGVLTVLAESDIDATGNVTKMVGRDRFGLVPAIANGPFKIGDTIFLASRSVVQSLSPDELKNILAGVGNTKELLEHVAAQFLSGTAVIIKRVKI
ncbi:hypothetical protein HY948_05040 [Candidatus Gottesmanbacteria bacterium]|nr:hypothetical protein [Candidatus Gottesmanbacteria bacterium]